MAAKTAVDLNAAQGDYPFGQSEATKMLARGLEEAEKTHGWSQRQVAKMLDYRTSVVISHMASGRVPIPIDRALDFARLLKLQPSEFLLAVLGQRYPDIDWARLAAGAPRKAAVKQGESYVTSELEALAGSELDHLPQQVVNVLRDVVADRNAPKRWLALHELPIIDKLRTAHPRGLDHDQRRKLSEFIEAL